MTNLKWPAELPQLMRLEGLSGTRKTAVVRTEMDAGPAKARQRYTVSTKEFSGSVVLTENQRQILENWYLNTLGSGVLRFRMVNPQTLEEKEFRFLEDYQESAIDGLWEIQMKLEMMNA